MSLLTEHKNLTTEALSARRRKKQEFWSLFLREPKVFSVSSVSPWCKVISNKVYYRTSLVGGAWGFR